MCSQAGGATISTMEGSREAGARGRGNEVGKLAIILVAGRGRGKRELAVGSFGDEVCARARGFSVGTTDALTSRGLFKHTEPAEKGRGAAGGGEDGRCGDAGSLREQRVKQREILCR